MQGVRAEMDGPLLRGIAWVSGVKWLTQLVSWAVTFLVLRLLRPSDYGLFGMAMAYIGLAQFLGEAGLITVVLKLRDLPEALAARLHGLAIVIAFALVAATLLLAGGVAYFFGVPDVRAVVMALSLSLLLRGIQVVPRAAMARALAFRQLAWVDGIETLGVACSTLGYALAGLGAWSLVAGVLTGVALSAFWCLWWRPQRAAWPGRLRELHAELALGGHVVASQLAWYIYSNADFAVVGRWLGQTALGAYTVGWTMATIAVDRVSALVGRVTPPLFAAIQHDLPALRRYACLLTEGLALATLPACVGLALVGDDLVEVLLGPSWRAAVAPLRLLAIFAAVRCLVTLLPQLLIFTGHARRNTAFNFFAAAALPPLFYVGSRWGVTGVAAVWMLAYPALIGVFYLPYVLRVLELPWHEFLAALRPAFIATGVMSAVVLATGHALPATMTARERLATLIVVGAGACAGFVFTAYRRRVRTLVAVLRTHAPAADWPRAPRAGVGTHLRQHRLLLITYHFPPDPAVGSLRWRKLARFAVERGWGVDVVMRDPRGIPKADPSTLADLPDDVRVFHVPDGTAFVERAVSALAGARRRLRRSIGGPAHGVPHGAEWQPRATVRWQWHARALARHCLALVEAARGRRWARAAVRRCEDVLRADGRPRAVIASGPPFWALVAAQRVSRRHGLPLVVDFRDPWTLAPHVHESVASPLHLAVARTQERAVVRDARLVVANTEALRDAMMTQHPAVRARAVTVMNGVDDDELPRIPPTASFTIRYAGTLYLDRDPRPLLRGVRRAAEAFRPDGAELAVEFMGDVASYEGVSLDRIARDEGVAQVVRILPVCSRDEALRFVQSASLLVTLSVDSDLAVPAKLFDYMRSEAQLLALAPPESATARLLAGTSAHVVHPRDVAGIAQAILLAWRAHLDGRRTGAIARDPRFSRRERARVLFDAVERIAGSPATKQALPQFEQPGAHVRPTPDFVAVGPRTAAQELEYRARA